MGISYPIELSKNDASSHEVPITSGFWPHVRWMAELVNSPANTLNVTWEVFQDAQPISLPRGSADEDDNMNVILVRVEGDPAEGPQIFRETDGDKRVKRMVEEHLGGPWNDHHHALFILIICPHRTT